MNRCRTVFQAEVLTIEDILATLAMHALVLLGMKSTKLAITLTKFGTSGKDTNGTVRVFNAHRKADTVSRVRFLKTSFNGTTRVNGLLRHFDL